MRITLGSGARKTGKDPRPAGAGPRSAGSAMGREPVSPFETRRRRSPLRANPSAVTMHVSAWYGRDEGPPTSGVSPIRRGIALTCTAGGCARPNHGLTPVVTAVVFAEE
jgi:hypothetical protein